MNVETQLAGYSLSSIDEDRFGARTGRASLVSESQLPGLLEWCDANEVELLIARCPASSLDTLQKLEGYGFELMDTLICYRRDLRRPLPSVDQGSIVVRPVRPGEEEAVKYVAAESFSGYGGHYHADHRLSRTACDEVYSDWAYRSCIDRTVADEVLVAERDGEIVAFTTLKMNTPEEGQVVLTGVAESARGQRIYQIFKVHEMEWLIAHGAATYLASTQIVNFVVQKIWVRMGFEPSEAFYTVHKWFPRSRPVANRSLSLSGSRS